MLSLPATFWGTRKRVFRVGGPASWSGSCMEHVVEELTGAMVVGGAPDDAEVVNSRIGADFLGSREEKQRRGGVPGGRKFSWRGESTGMVFVSWIFLLPYRFVCDFWGLISFSLFIVMLEHEHWGFCYVFLVESGLCCFHFLFGFLVRFLTYFMSSVFGILCFDSPLKFDWDTFSTYPNT